MYCKIKKNKDSITYSYVDGNDRNLDILRIFLAEEVGLRGGEIFRQWALKKEEEDIYGAHTWLELFEEKIYIHCDWHIGTQDPPEMVLSPNAFLSAIDQWNSVVKNLPEYISIKEENGRIMIDESEA